MITSHWKKMVGSRCQVGSADPRVRPAPYGPTDRQPGPMGSLTAISFEILDARPNFASKDVHNYFSKDFHARKYFWIFVKAKKC